MKHIQFSRGYLFMDDLKMADDVSELDFTYNLGDKMRMDVNKQGRDEDSEKIKNKNFSNLKKLMGGPEEEKGRVFDYEIPEEITFKQPEKTLNEENLEDNKFETFGQTDPMVASLNRTLAHKETLKSSMMSSNAGNNTLGDSLAYSQTAGTMLKNSIKKVPMEVIQSEDDEGSSQISGKKGHVEEEDDDMDRFEDIDLKTVSMESVHVTPSKKKLQKPILSPEEVEEIRKQKEQEAEEKRKRVEEYTQK